MVLAVVAACAAAAASALGDGYDDAVQGCGQAATEQPFAAYGDYASYFMVPNGSFAAGTADWGLTGTATTIDDLLEPDFVDVAGDATALLIPKGSTATSTPVCVTSDTPAIRFFARTNGKPGAVLKVDAVFKSEDGKLYTLPVGTIGGTTSWAPTPPLRLLLTPLTAISQAPVTGVAFRFTAINGSWKIDRVFVDPLKECC